MGKWAVDTWFRVPKKLFRDLEEIKTDSPFVFAAYNQQLREFYEKSRQPWQAKRVASTFNPVNLGDWFYERVRQWSESQPDGPACIQMFRKTTLQYARAGEDLNRQVAADAWLGTGVMMTNYVDERE